MRRLLVTLFLLAGIPVFAAQPKHDLYLCVSQSKPFVIGMKVQQLNGIYRIDDQETPVHVGFNHPRQDTLTVDPRGARTIFSVGLNGVLRYSIDGKSCRIMTSWDMTEPKDIAIDPHAPDTLYIGLPDGIGVSHDGGQTWKRSNKGITRSYTQSILVDRTRQGRVLAGTELGIYLSEDGAKTWRRVFETSHTVNDIKQSPHDPRVMLAVTQSDGAVLSRDGGATWKAISQIDKKHTLHNGDFDATDPKRLAVSGWGCGVLVSEDGGATWVSRNDGLPNREVWRVAIDPDRPGRLYASPHQNAVFSSDDFGRTWKKQWFEAATVWDFVFVPRQ
ncbi:WD40/YVTN/BNR-like repeat-containing protein [Nibricoccus aquaticus]|nr:hypothetical protein [Nibricoccus aquaticus]